MEAVKAVQGQGESGESGNGMGGAESDSGYALSHNNLRPKAFAGFLRRRGVGRKLWICYNQGGKISIFPLLWAGGDGMAVRK